MFSKLLPPSSHCLGEAAFAFKLNGAKEFHKRREIRHGPSVRTSRPAYHSGLSKSERVRKINYSPLAPPRSLHPICPTCAARAVIEITSQPKEEDYYVCKAPKKCNCPLCKDSNSNNLEVTDNKDPLSETLTPLTPCSCPVCMTKFMANTPTDKPYPTQYCKLHKSCDCSLCTAQTLSQKISKSECSSKCRSPKPCCCPLCMTKLMTKPLSTPKKDKSCKSPQVCYCSDCVKKLLAITNSTGTIVKDDECQLPNPCCCIKCMARRKSEQEGAEKSPEDSNFCRAPLPCSCPQCVARLSHNRNISEVQQQKAVPRCKSCRAVQQQVNCNALMAAPQSNYALCSRIDKFKVPKEVPDIFAIRQYCTSEVHKKGSAPIRKYRTTSDTDLHIYSDCKFSKLCDCPKCTALRQQESQFHQFNHRHECCCPHCNAGIMQNQCCCPHCNAGMTQNQCCCPHCTAGMSQHRCCCSHCMSRRGNYNERQCCNCMHNGNYQWGHKGCCCCSNRRCQSQTAMCPRTYLELKQYSYQPNTPVVQSDPMPSNEADIQPETTTSAPSRVPLPTIQKKSYSTFTAAANHYRSRSFMGCRGYSRGLCPGGGSGGKIIPPADCLKGPVPYNPCRPSYPAHEGGHKKYKSIFFFVCLPIILAQYTRIAGEEVPHKEAECREYEYMRRRTKRFPWGDGNKSFFHNDHTNHLPEHCTPAEKDMCL